MNGIQDMGGMHDMGPIVHEANEPVFHEEWERRAFAMLLLCLGGGHYNLDMARRAIELMPPAEYLATTYYEHWMHALEELMIEDGSLTRAEIDQRAEQLAATGVQ